MQIRELILEKKLHVGIKMPSSRELSNQLKVSRNTVISAYNELIEQSYLITHPAGGTYVTSVLPERFQKAIYISQFQPDCTTSKHISHYPAVYPGIYQSEPGFCRYNFTLEQTDFGLFPVKIWRKIVNNKLSRIRHAISHYGHPFGIIELREAIYNNILPSRGIAVSPDQVIITAGTQQGLSIVSHLLIREGTNVIVEEPTYAGALNLFQSYSANIIPLEVDDKGMNIDLIPDVSVQLAYVTPTHQSPLGVTLSYHRRKKFIEWSKKTGSYIVELDLDGEFWYEGSPLPALFGMSSSNNVFYLGSFSKLLGPGLRLGYMVIPEHLIDDIKAIKALLDSGHPWLDQAVMADFILSGSYSWHLRKIRQKFLNRRDCMIDALKNCFGDIELSGTEAGSHLVWRVPDKMRPANKLVKIFAKNQVAISTLEQFQTISCDKVSRLSELVFLGYSAVPEDLIEEGISEMAKLVS